MSDERIRGLEAERRYWVDASHRRAYAHRSEVAACLKRIAEIDREIAQLRERR